MKHSTIDLLVCPKCHGGLNLQAEGGTYVEQGNLQCTGCNTVYPIEKGIPHFIRSDELTGLNRRFARAYDWVSYLYRPVSTIFFAFVGGEKRGRSEIVDRLEPKGGRVLEVSIGPGVNLPYLCGSQDVGEVFWLGYLLWTITTLSKLCRDASIGLLTCSSEMLNNYHSKINPSKASSTSGG